MDREYERNRTSSQVGATAYSTAVDPQQSGRSAFLHKPEYPVPSGLVQRKCDACNRDKPTRRWSDVRATDPVQEGRPW